ncbi:dehydratase [Amycolatopsis xylanica]|uniref:Dehydratase n=1 Tax=Amycolatopsis xylanica TaxID=589385 RepID=A0A1H3HE82_9PSEU|nr:cyclase [Amycolatopsis xylanica]SDY13782.1 dehydratase [Amycolatopsis xylanica]
MKSALRRTLTAAALAAIPALALTTPASAATSINFDCQANAPIVGPQKANFAQDATVTAPATVAPGANLDIVIDPAPNTLPTTVAGYKLKEVKTFAFKFPIPANSTFVKATLSGGSGLGSTPPTIAVSGGVATLSFPGPIKGGAAFELPTVTATLKAGASGTIQTKIAGTSYTDPGLTFTAVVSSFIDVSAPTACFPNPSPVFTTTTIG